MDLTINEIIEVSANQKLLDSFCDSVGIAAAIIDLEGKIIIGSRWQKLCTDFHRKNRRSCEKCIKSDTILANFLKQGENYSLYRCQNGLTDAASPIVIHGQHIANAFVGQFLLNPPDINYFRQQAIVYGFDENAYLEALSKVPIIEEKNVPVIVNFLVSYAEMLAGMVLKYEKQLKSERQLLKAEQDISERKKYEAQLQKANQQIEMEKNFSDTLIKSLPGVFYLFDESIRFKRWNINFERITGYSSDEIASLSALDMFDDEDLPQITKCIKEVFEKGESKIEADLLTKNGEKIPYYFTGMKFQSNNKPFIVGVGIDISSQKRVLQSMEIDSKRLLSILDGIEDIIYVADPETYELLHANEAFMENWGKEVIGKKCYKILQDRDEPCPFCTNNLIFGEYLDRPYVWEFQNEINKNWYRCSDKAIQWVDGRMVRFEIATDISQVKLLNASLKVKNEQLACSNKELEQFAYVASHDLQEPLRMVASYTELLQERYMGKLDEKADKYIGYAVEGAKRMQMLINDLLVLSRVNTRGKPFKPVDCSELVGKVLHGLANVIHEKQAQIHVETLPTIMGDEIQLFQLFQNFIANAIKFHGDEQPVVKISAARKNLAWVFSVQDNGIGIDPEFFERIFVIFQRLHERGAYGGSGIGLSIAKKIVERHGGKIWVESEPGKGSTFYFTLKEENSLQEATV